MDVREIIYNYRENKEMLELLKLEEPLLELSASSISDMPRGSNISNPTALKADQMDERRRELTQEILLLGTRIKQAEKLCNSERINARYKWILNRKYIDGNDWDSVQSAHAAEYYEVDKDQLAIEAHIAINKLQSIVDASPVMRKLYGE